MTPPGQPDPARADPARTGTLARALRATSGMTLLSRLGGLVRDVLIGRVFADSPLVGSAFNAAFAIPNMFRRLFGEGALSAAFIPAYTAARKESDPAVPASLASLTLAVLGLVTAALTILLEVALLVLLLTLPHDPERALSLRLVMVMLPFMPCICVAAILAGMLQVHGRFGPAASGPILLNVCIVAVAGLCLGLGVKADEPIAYALGAATVLSGVTQAAWFLKLLRPHVTLSRRPADWRSARPRAALMFRKFIPVAVGLGTLQLSTFLDTLIAMWPIWVGPTMLGHPYPMDEASNFILGQTSRLYQFPLGVFGIAVATAIFPLLARAADDRPVFLDTLRRGVRLSLFIGVPASVGLLLVRRDAIALLYAHGPGAWSPEQIDRAAAVLAGFALGVWAYALNHVLTRAFYARQDTATPMRVSIAMVIVGLIMNMILIWTLREAGLAWATTIAATAQSVTLLIIARARMCAPGEALLDRATLRAIARIAAAAAGMAAAVWLTLRFMPASTALAPTAARVAAAIAAGAGTYLAAALLMRAPELKWILARPPRTESAAPPPPDL